MRNLFLISILTMAMVFTISETAYSGIFNASGKVTLLRVHDVGTKYGPANDQIDAEVIIKLNTQAGQAFGFKLRNDTNALVHKGMLDILRDAFEKNWTVSIDHARNPGKKNGIILRIWVKR